MLARSGFDVILTDSKERALFEGLEETLDSGARFVRETEVVEHWPAPDLVVKSPGVPTEAAPVTAARQNGVPVWSELELAYALLPNPFDAITGTNGKTTTTALLGHLFATAGKPARVLGNIGVAVTSVVGQAAPDEELVVEVSSFQLEDIHHFRPAAAIFLNLTPDHLDRHGSMERYLACKENLFSRQGSEDVAVLNLADPVVAGVGARLAARVGGPRVAFFSSLGSTGTVRRALSVARDAVPSADARPAISPQGPGLVSWVEGDVVFLEGEPALKTDEVRLPGLHNLENCLGAATAALARGVERAAVVEGLRTFTGVEHRLERAGFVAGVTYVNDSKATNVEATLKALSAYPERTHLILGGRDKGSDYRPVARASASGCKGVYLIGEATPLIEAAFAEVRSEPGGESVPELRSCGDLEQAVLTAARAATPGDVILLAPACASFDQYGSFEERGAHFRAIVAKIAGEGPH